MDSSKLNNWMQVIGIFALVASLIKVIAEIDTEVREELRE